MIDCRATFGREANGENAHGYRCNLADPGSCEVSKGATITLEEWRRQNDR
jgi:hypothetical protein